VQELFLDVRMNSGQPLLCAFSLLSVRIDLGLKLGNPLFRRAKLMRQPLCRINRVSAVLFGDVGSLIEKLEDRLAGLIELSIQLGSHSVSLCHLSPRLDKRSYH
jgi:hypothetical protein